MAAIRTVQLVVGMEVHVELSTQTKAFSRAPNPASVRFDGAPPNTLIDPTVLGLPGALPVLNLAAVEMSMMVGLALGCRIASQTRWDRKSYFYPDLPKGYQISQYDLPLCFDGAFDLPGCDEKGDFDPAAPATRVGIIRAHLEEDAGKLLHEAPGGAPIDFSIVDLNRAGAPLLEIVTQPDFTSPGQCVAFARSLRSLCRFLGVTEGVLQKGHMRFEPNINTVLTLDDGRQATTPIVEVKNLNSYRALRAAVEFELREQPRRWLDDAIEHGPGRKTTRGWDDSRGVTFAQREKEDAHDYRYFPDPDLPPVTIDSPWVEALRARLPEPPLTRRARYVEAFALSPREAEALSEERDLCLFYEQCIDEMVSLGSQRPAAGRAAANLLLQSGAKRANERAVQIVDLGIRPAQVAGIGRLRELGRINAGAADQLFGLFCEPGNEERDAESLASERAFLIVHDENAAESWADAAIAENPQAAADVRAGKQAAVGRIVGAAMKLAGGKADAKSLRDLILRKLGE